jgi:hypothetical protein
VIRNTGKESRGAAEARQCQAAQQANQRHSQRQIPAPSEPQSHFPFPLCQQWGRPCFPGSIWCRAWCWVCTVQLGTSLTSIPPPWDRWSGGTRTHSLLDRVSALTAVLWVGYTFNVQCCRVQRMYEVAAQPVGSASRRPGKGQTMGRSRRCLCLQYPADYILRAQRTSHLQKSYLRTPPYLHQRSAHGSSTLPFAESSQAN